MPVHAELKLDCCCYLIVYVASELHPRLVNGLMDIAGISITRWMSRYGISIYLQKHEITQNALSFRAIVDRNPLTVGIDPFNKMIDRNPADNVAVVE